MRAGPENELQWVQLRAQGQWMTERSREDESLGPASVGLALGLNVGKKVL